MHEAKVPANGLRDVACFLTLTYSDEALPRHGVLVKSDLQNFFKALRRELCTCEPLDGEEPGKVKCRKDTHKLRYFACGEYGSKHKTRRPHFHICLFGHDFLETRQREADSPSGEKLYSSDVIAAAWDKGMHRIGELTFTSAQYVASYVMKKRTGKKKETKDHYTQVCFGCGEVYELPPEFVVRSTRPGIGLAWLEQYVEDIYPRDEMIVNGVPTKPPRYYDRKVAEVAPDLVEGLKKARAERAKLLTEHNTPERLAKRELLHKKRMSRYRRDRSE